MLRRPIETTPFIRTYANFRASATPHNTKLVIALDFLILTRSRILPILLTIDSRTRTGEASHA